MSEPEDLKYATFEWRTVAHLIDLVVITILFCGTYFAYCIIDFLATGNEPPTGRSLPEAIILISIQWAYFALLESSPWQATIGKKICRMKVTDTQGQRISLLRATGRYWLMPLSKLCYIGYLAAAFSPRVQTWHDKLARTVVLREPRPEADQQTPPESAST